MKKDYISPHNQTNQHKRAHLSTMFSGFIKNPSFLPFHHHKSHFVFPCPHSQHCGLLPVTNKTLHQSHKHQLSLHHCFLLLFKPFIQHPLSLHSKTLYFFCSHSLLPSANTKSIITVNTTLTQKQNLISVSHIISLLLLTIN